VKIIEKCRSHNCGANSMELIAEIIEEFKQEDKKADFTLLPTVE
jgi:hypothetical protein